MSKQKIKTDRGGKGPANKQPLSVPDTAVAAQTQDSPHNKVDTETRVDAAHTLDPHSAENQATQSKTAEAKNKTNQESSSAEQLRTQATQLGDRLRSRQEDLDRREAQLNARVAQLDNDARTARLWFSESRKEFDRRELELAEKTGQMQQCLGRLARVEETNVRRQTKLDTQAERLGKDTKSLEKSRQRFAEEQQQQREQTERFAAREQQQIDTRRQASLVLVRQSLSGLERRRSQVESHARRLLKKAAQPSKELLAREETVREAAEEFQRRRQQNIESEQSLARQQCEVQELRRALLAQREELHRREQKRSQAAADQRDKMQVELEAKRKQLALRSEQLDCAQTALRHLRAELSEMHRQTLELRLATEELWMQLSGTIPPATLTRSLSRIRGSLAETYRVENAELARRKLELRSIGSELAEDHKSLQQQKVELDAWIVRHQREIEQQAQRLVAREQELHDQEAGFEEKARGWATSRLEYQQEIRRLRDQLDEAAENGKIRSGLCGVF